MCCLIKCEGLPCFSPCCSLSDFKERGLLLKEREALPGSHQTAHLIVSACLAVVLGGMCSHPGPQAVQLRRIAGVGSCTWGTKPTASSWGRIFGAVFGLQERATAFPCLGQARTQHWERKTKIKRGRKCGLLSKSPTSKLSG